jgi:hypothetical protein
MAARGLSPDQCAAEELSAHHPAELIGGVLQSVDDVLAIPQVSLGEPRDHVTEKGLAPVLVCAG